MNDAVVIGSGPNGLVAANLLVDAGWDVLVLEAQPTIGGAVRSSEMMEPDFVNDHCSAFYPLGAASPHIADMGLENYGLRWTHAPFVVAHPSLDGSCPIISRNIEETVDSLGPDGDAWRRLYAVWEQRGDELIEALFTPFPPVRSGARLVKGIAWKELIRFARFAVLPVRRMGEEHFTADPARRLLGGLALHADLLPESQLSGFYGWMLAALGQSVGFPSPEGGAGNLTKAMAQRLRDKGGDIRVDALVKRVITNGSRATGVELADGERIPVGKAVLADVDAPQLYTRLLREHDVPADIRRDIERFQWDNATVKVDWNLDAPIAWSAEGARRAGTVHIAESVDELSVTSSELARGLVPTDPFLLFGQQSIADPTRAPAGAETAWAYTHVPMNTGWTRDDLERFADRMQARVEALAPGFGSTIRKRMVMGPVEFEEGNYNLVEGALGGGTAQLHQQLVFRPTAGLGRPETHIPGLFLASSAAHPGGGVHGACGANAAMAALHGPVKRAAVTAIRWAGRKQSAGKQRLIP